MTKKEQKSIAEKKPRGYYALIGKACGCSGQYVKMVLNAELGEYQNRDTDLVQKIHAKAEELSEFFGLNK